MASKPGAGYMQQGHQAGPNGNATAPGMNTGATFQSTGGSPIQQMKMAANSAGPPPNMTVGMNGNIGGGPPINTGAMGGGVPMQHMQAVASNPHHAANQQYLQSRMGDSRASLMYQQGNHPSAASGVAPGHFAHHAGAPGVGVSGATPSAGGGHYNSMMMMGGGPTQGHQGTSQHTGNDFSGQGNQRYEIFCHYQVLTEESFASAFRISSRIR